MLWCRELKDMWPVKHAELNNDTKKKMKVNLVPSKMPKETPYVKFWPDLLIFTLIKNLLKE